LSFLFIFAHFCHYNPMPKTKLLILSLAVALQITIPHFAAAASIDIPCRPSDTAQGKTQEQVKSENQVALFTCVNQLYKYALVICSIAAVFMIILGGYMYIFSGGSDKKVATAKSFISTSLLGIGVLLTGFLLLKQINPELLTIKNITPQQIGGRSWYVMRVEDGYINVGGGNRGGGTSTIPVVRDCPGGQLVEIPQGEFTQYDQNRACPILLDALRRLKAAATTAGKQFKVNDAYGPDHQSSCHRLSGTCVDIGVLAGTSYDELCKVVNDTGIFRLLNESQQNTPNCGPDAGTGNPPHLHLNLRQ
jgi:hypothetical protein